MYKFKRVCGTAGIEEIGVEIEEPFGILPLNLISEKAQANIRELLLRADTIQDVIDSIDPADDDDAQQKAFMENGCGSIRGFCMVIPKIGPQEP